MALHRYAYINGRDEIISVTEPRSSAPPPMIVGGVVMLCQQVADDCPATHSHNAHLFEPHSPRIVMRADRKVYQEWSLRRKSGHGADLMRCPLLTQSGHQA
jgi:hypothetical protein